MLNIASNRSTPKYTSSEQVLRILWSLGLWIFRLSPRPCFGFRRWWLRLFGARIGQRVNLYPSTHVYFPWNFSVGDDSSIGEWALIYNLGPVTLGSRVTISPRAHLCAGTHDHRDPTMPLQKPPIVIESDAWICADAFVGPGVIVAEGAVVGARGVVIRNVPAWTVVAGNPAKEVGRREISRSR